MPFSFWPHSNHRICHEFKKWGNTTFKLLTLSHIQTVSDAWAAKDFWKQCGKKRNCSLWALSHSATIFSLHKFKNYSYIYRDFSWFCHMFSIRLLQICCTWERFQCVHFSTSSCWWNSRIANDGQYSHQIRLSPTKLMT